MTPDELDLAAGALTIVAEERGGEGAEAEERLALRLRTLANTLRATPSSGTDTDELMAELHFAIDQQLALIGVFKIIAEAEEADENVRYVARWAMQEHYARGEQRVKDLEDSGRYS